MRIFIDIGHPAHVHYFKNFIKIMEQHGHEFLITARDKDVAHKLLKSYNFPFINRGKGKGNLFGKFIYIWKADLLLYKLAKRYKPDLLLSFASPYAAHVAKLIGKPHIVFDDTENAWLNHILYAPFSNVILSPNTFLKCFSRKQIFFNSYMELCYLHPNYYKPRTEVSKILGIGADEKYIILRFVSWLANHDIGHSGLTNNHKIKCVKSLSDYAKVFIVSESELPMELEKYRINIPAEMMHDALNYCSLLYGESATMASECAVLGVPSIYFDNVGRGYTDEEETKYGIVHNFSESLEDQQKGLEKAIKILETNDNKKYVQIRDRILSDKIDPTAFMVWFVENYPGSATIMKENPEYQNRFKLS